MGHQEAAPVEINDFSGGLTDNVLQGGPTRYEKADNFLLTVDHKLEERPGTRVYDPLSYDLTSHSRTANLFLGLRETQLFAHSNQSIYTRTQLWGSSWDEVLGPTGNRALGGANIYSKVTTAEFQRQLYYTSDAATLPGKLYRDSTNAWKAVTAGMPAMQWVPTYPDDATLLAACITLANSLRTSMIAHFQDQANSGTYNANFQHSYEDKWSESYLQAVVWNGGDPENPGPLIPPTPAPAATDAATLYALCLALSFAYEHHRHDLAGNDPTKDKGARKIHQPIYYELNGNPAKQPEKLGINARLTNSATLSTLTKAATFLDDLAQKWYWHQLSPFSHSQTNDLTRMSTHLLNANNSLVKIGTIYDSKSTIQVVPNYIDFQAFASYIQVAWNNHANGTETFSGAHIQVDLFGPITLASPVDYDSAALTIFWARWLYGLIHIPDAAVPTFELIQYHGTSGSASLTAVKDHLGAAYTAPLGSYISSSLSGEFNDATPANQRGAKVTASGSGTATTSRTAAVTGTNIGEALTYSRLHAYRDTASGNYKISTTSYVTAAENLTTGLGDIGASLSTWIQLGAEYLLCFAAHINNAALHNTGTFNLLPNELDYPGINGNPFFIPEVVSYGWAATYRNQYVVEPNGILYVSEGPPVFSSSVQTFQSFPVGTTIAVPAGYTTVYPNSSTKSILIANAAATLRNIPPLVNTGLTNYDTTVSITPTTTNPSNAGYNQNLTLELYRTTNGGTTFYHLASLSNNSDNTYVKDYVNETHPTSVADTLNLQPTLYTSGGVLANDPPPRCKYTHEFAGYTYYGAVYDAGQFFPQRIRQSSNLNPDSANAENFDDLEDDLMGLSSTRSNLLALCKTSVYRISGAFTDTGGGAMVHEKSVDSVGCVSTRSIVKTEIGVFYAGTDGFYFTDGYQDVKVSMELNRTYAALTKTEAQRSRIYGAYDKLNRRVWWAVQSQAYAADNDEIFVFYLDYGVKPAGVFTKIVPGAGSWNPSSLCFFNGEAVIGDKNGYLYTTDLNVKTDPEVVTTEQAYLWNTVVVPWNYRSAAMDLGSSAARKYITKIHLLGENVGNAAIQINSINDGGAFQSGAPNTLALAVIQYTRNLRFGDPTTVWGDASTAFGKQGMLDAWRRFPSRSYRSRYKQVEFVPASVVVYGYDSYPEFAYAVVDATAGTATLLTPTGYSALTWPDHIVGYSISFDTDAYTTLFPIIGLSDDRTVVTFSGTATAAATAKWQISGVKKEQKFKLLEYDLAVTTVTADQGAYLGKTGAGGEGANV